MMIFWLLDTPTPTSASPYPPTFPVSGSTLPLVWAAVILVAIILIATLLSARKGSEDKTRPIR